ncbi:MAG: hypothetical protein EOO47_00035 [Flavobacterium sp.]|nr:MAG: hypothetical protein EOO47_00035 [Flavobacterium sp.]
MNIENSKIPYVCLQILMDMLAVQHLHTEMLIDLAADGDAEKKVELAKKFTTTKPKYFQELVDRIYVEYGEVPE